MQNLKTTRAHRMASTIPAALLTSLAALYVAPIPAEAQTPTAPVGAPALSTPRAAYEHLDLHRGLVRPGAAVRDDDHAVVWFASLGGASDQGGPAAALSFEGAAFGAETRLGNRFAVGGAISAGETSPAGDRYGMKGGALSLYASADSADWGRVSLSATRGGHKVDDILGGAGRLGGTDVSSWEVELAARSTVVIGPVRIDHGVALAAGRIKADGYAESGPDARRYSDQTLEYRLASIDARARGAALQLAQDVSVRPLVDLSYAHQFGDDAYTLTVLAPSARVVNASAPAEDRLSASIGAELIIGERWALTGRYGRRWANDLDDADRWSVTLAAHF